MQVLLLAVAVVGLRRSGPLRFLSSLQCAVRLRRSDCRSMAPAQPQQLQQMLLLRLLLQLQLAGWCLMHWLQQQAAALGAGLRL